MDTKGIGGLVVLLIVGAIAIAVGGVPALAHNGAIQENLETTGTITNTGVDKRVTTDSDGNREVEYRPIIEYEYAVDGRNYSHDNVFPGSFTRWQGSRSWAAGVASNYQSGQEVTVFYNPRDHSHAYVHEGGVPGSWIFGAGYAVLAILAGAGYIRTGFKRRNQRNLMEDTPTENARSLSMGPSEIKGSAVSVDGPRRAPFTDEESVIATWKIEEYDDDADDDGGSWKTVDSGLQLAPFYVEDETGQVLVEPHETATYEFDDEDWTTIYVDSSDYGPDPVQTFVESNPDLDYPSNGGGKDGDRRYKQNLIRPGEDVYVFGTVQPREESGGRGNAENLVIKNVDEDDPRAEPMFLISDNSERELVESRQFALWRLPVGVVLIVGGLGLLLGMFGQTLGISLPVPPQLL